MNFIAENELEKLLSNELDFLFILNMDGNIIKINTAVKSILGYSSKELNNKNLSTIYSFQHREEIGTIIPLVVKGDIYNCPYPFATRDNKIIPVNTKFYMGWWKGENIIAAIGSNLAAEYFSQEVFFNIFNGSQIMMAITNIESNVVFNVNNAFLETLGYRLEEVSGKTVHELGIYYNYSQRETMLQQFFDKGKVEGEATIKAKTGELLECLFSFQGVKIREEDYLLAAVTDITERKKMENKLKYLNYQQKLLVDIAQLFNKSENFDDVICTVLSLIGKHVNVSRVYIFENTADEQYTSNIYEWCNEGIEKKRDEFQMFPFSEGPSWKKMLKEEGHIFSTHIEELPQDIVRILKPIGIKSILVYSIYIESHFWGFMGFDECIQNKVWSEDEMNLLLSVTNYIANALERKLHLTQLKDSELRLKLALRGAKEGLWDWNLQTDEIYFTDTCYTMLGYDTNESSKKGDWWRAMIHPDDIMNVKRAFKDHLKNKTDYYECVFRVKDKQGRWRWILDHGKVIERDKDGKAIRAVGTHIDMNKQKMIEQQLQNMLVTKDKLFSIIAHDLRGPVGNFMQIIELLTSDIQIAPEMQTSLLNELRDTSKNTFYLLENLLNWSRSQRNEIIYNPVSFVINDLILQNISLLSIPALQKSINMQFSEKINHEVYADYDMINLVIRNLLSNAIKFTKTNGNIIVGLSEQNELLEIMIEDDGVGMPPEIANSLFTDNQFHSTYGTNNEKGSGLGLVLCKDFVLRNRGTIRVESTIGIGSKFIFTVPLSPK